MVGGGAGVGRTWRKHAYMLDREVVDAWRIWRNAWIPNQSHWLPYTSNPFLSLHLKVKRLKQKKKKVISSLPLCVYISPRGICFFVSQHHASRALPVHVLSRPLGLDVSSVHRLAITQHILSAKPHPTRLASGPVRSGIPAASPVFHMPIT